MTITKALKSPSHDLSLGAASARFAEGVLTVATGRCERRWQWTDTGFATCGLAVGDRRVLLHAVTDADWRLPGDLSRGGARLLDLRIDEADDEGFTARHLRVVAEIAYPEAGLTLRWTVWAWPEAPGLRTVCALRGEREPGVAAAGAVPSERIPIDLVEGLRLRAVGYYAGTQRRNQLDTPLLRDEAIAVGGACDWASLLAGEADGLGVALVKESHRCVNVPGHDGGSLLAVDGLSSTGWGLLPGEIAVGDWREGWATWTIVYEATNRAALARAVRGFLAHRYPADPRRDLVPMSNTWGSTAHSRDARDAARCDNVLRELASAADLGLESVQIDDGWQVSYAAANWLPEPGAGWVPHPHPYPEGWGPVRAEAERLGVKLGLWAAGQPVTLEELQRAVADGGFSHLKLDFMVLADRAAIDGVMHKVRTLIRDGGHRVHINWDSTESEPRVGYFYGREYGGLYLANRKPHLPESTVYRPCTMLRDAWQLAHYQRLQSVQITVQDPRRTARTSDAWQHGDAYCLAIALMAWPVYFMQTQFLGAEARAAIRPLLVAWKRVRPLLLTADVSPIGAEPDNTRWTGFHADAGEEGGLLLVYRELENADPAAGITIPALAGKRLALEDLRCGRTWTEVIGADGRLALTLDRPADFRYLRYRFA